MTEVAREQLAVLELAVGLYRQPWRLQRWRQSVSELPTPLTPLLRLLAPSQDDEGWLAGTAIQLDTTRERLCEAARFFVEQVCLVETGDYYRIMGLPPDCSEAQLKEHYRLLMRAFHPDRAGVSDSWADRFAERVNQAYGILRRPDARARYDQRRRYLPTADDAWGEVEPSVTRPSPPTAAVPPFSPLPVAPGELPQAASRRWPLRLVAGVMLTGSAAVVLYPLAKTVPLGTGQGSREATARIESPPESRPLVEPQSLVDSPPPVESPPLTESAPSGAVESTPVAAPGDPLSVVDAPLAASPSAEPPTAPEPSAPRDTAEEGIAPRFTTLLTIPLRSVESPPQPDRVSPATRQVAPAATAAAAATVAVKPQPEPTPARTAVPPPEPVTTVPVSPSTLGVDDLKAVIQQLQRAYERGDLNGFMNLFAGDVRSNAGTGAGLIRRQYQVLFATTGTRSLQLSNVRLHAGRDNTGKVDAAYRIHLRDRDGRAPRVSNGTLHLGIVRQDDGMPRITEFFHHGGRE